MENKQTAVEWLFDKITHNKEIRWRGTKYEELFAQAKAMEKEQIMEAYEDGKPYYIEKDISMISSEQYYEETYGAQLPKE